MEQESETTITYSRLREIARVIILPSATPLLKDLRSKENASLLRAADVVRPGKVIMTYFDSHRDNVLWFWSITAAGGIPTVLSSLAHDLKTREAQNANVESIFAELDLLTSQHLASNVNPQPGVCLVVPDL